MGKTTRSTIVESDSVPQEVQEVQEVQGNGTPATPPEAVETTQAARTAQSIQMIQIDRIVVGEEQVRRSMDDSAIKGLSESLKTTGLLNPITLQAETEGVYTLIAGERRLRAAELAGWTEIAAQIRDLGRAERLEANLVENLQREELPPLEEAAGYRQLMDEMRYSIRKVAARLGKGKGYIEDRLRLLQLPPIVQQMVTQRADTLTHARELANVTDPALLPSLVAAVKEGLSLNDLRTRIHRLQAPEITAETAETEENQQEATETSEAASDAELPPHSAVDSVTEPLNDWGDGEGDTAESDEVAAVATAGNPPSGHPDTTGTGLESDDTSPSSPATTDAHEPGSETLDPTQSLLLCREQAQALLTGAQALSSAFPAEPRSLPVEEKAALRNVLTMVRNAVETALRHLDA